MANQENTFDLDSMPDFTEDSIAGEAEGLSPGFYFVAVTSEAEPRISQGGQAMVRLTLSPCREEGVAKSADASQRLDKYLMLPFLADKEKFTTKASEKAGQELGTDEVDAAWRLAQGRAEQDVLRSVAALIGWDSLPEVPRWDKDSRCYRTKDGVVHDKGEVDTLKRAQTAEAINTLKKNIKDNALVGFSCYAKVDTEEYNGNKKPAIKALYERLPSEASLRPVTKWFVKD